MITYSLGGVPVARDAASASASSESAKITSEIFERVLELEEIKKGGGVALIARLSTIATLSPSAFRTVLHVGCGQVEAVVASYEVQAKGRGLTRQALHWQWSQDQRAIAKVFPTLAGVLQDLRDTVAHHEDAMSPADAMRASRRSDGQNEANEG